MAILFTFLAGNTRAPFCLMSNIGLKAMIPGMWCIVATLLPFAAFQWFGFAAFCKLQKYELSHFPKKITDYGIKLNLTMPGNEPKPEWCFADPPIPFIALGTVLVIYTWQNTFYVKK